MSRSSGVRKTVIRWSRTIRGAGIDSTLREFVRDRRVADAGSRTRLPGCDETARRHETNRSAQRPQEPLQELDDQFDGGRYEAHIVVESRESAATHDRITDVLTEGLTLRDAPALDVVKREVFDNRTE